MSQDLPPRPAGPDRPGQSGRPGRTIVPMAGTEDLQPLILVHPLGGTLFHYRVLAKLVGSRFQVLGIQGDVLSRTTASGITERMTPLRVVDVLVDQRWQAAPMRCARMG